MVYLLPPEKCVPIALCSNSSYKRMLCSTAKSIRAELGASMKFYRCTLWRKNWTVRNRKTGPWRSLILLSQQLRLFRTLVALACAKWFIIYRCGTTRHCQQVRKANMWNMLTSNMNNSLIRSLWRMLITWHWRWVVLFVCCLCNSMVQLLLIATLAMWISSIGTRVQYRVETWSNWTIWISKWVRVATNVQRRNF